MSVSRSKLFEDISAGEGSMRRIISSGFEGFVGGGVGGKAGEEGEREGTVVGSGIMVRIRSRMRVCCLRDTLWLSMTRWCRRLGSSMQVRASILSAVGGLTFGRLDSGLVW